MSETCTYRYCTNLLEPFTLSLSKRCARFRQAQPERVFQVQRCRLNNQAIFHQNLGAKLSQQTQPAITSKRRKSFNVLSAVTCSWDTNRYFHGLPPTDRV